MDKEKFQVEYIFANAAKTSLWNYISTASGLSEWFADKVIIKDDVFIFIWDELPTRALCIESIPQSFIRFRWEDETNEEIYFEFRVEKIELTGGVYLQVTDFCKKYELDASISLWNSEIKTLKRILGI
ncbi:hypothetical protein AwDysgo_06810 [Bacteroidales bacterium]|nr:hypothetical protein AwDysgo_06810 [Bacteroidales bacterium]